ncbi:DUF1622 domain-containing protein [Aquicoccus sp. SCR17]|nr:DUF1622 domain-containing protein [Carideicomes alvinocaridis]
MNGLLGFETEETVLHAHFPLLIEVLDWVATAIDLCAILILLIGAIRFILGVFFAEVVRDDASRVNRTNRERIRLGRYILAGLELFIVSDVIHTALSLAFADLLFLLTLVIIRSITSWFLDKELEQVKKELEA